MMAFWLFKRAQMLDWVKLKKALDSISPENRLENHKTYMNMPCTIRGHTDTIILVH